MAGPRHVEFFGLPGSGKTTLVEHLARKNGEVYEFRTGYRTAVCNKCFPTGVSGICQRLPTGVVDMIARFIGLTGETSDAAFLSTARSLVPQYTDLAERQETVMGWIRTLFLRHQIARELLPQTATLLCDEGYLMRGNAVFSPANPTTDLNFDDVDRYLEFAPRPDFVVYLDIPLEVSERRIRTRESGPPESMANQDRKERRRRLRRMQTYVKHAYETLEGDGVRCFRVENDDLSLEEAMAEIATKLPL